MPPSPKAPLELALIGIDTWPVDHVAAIAVGPEGILTSRGEVARPFRLASITKAVFAAACLVAVEEGTLDLDEPAGPAGADGVTVRHLLAHAGGYGFDTGIMQRPGRTRIYSNTGIEVLASHLTERAAMAAGDYLKAAVLDPLGMVDTYLRDPSLAHGLWGTATDMAVFASELLRPTLVAPSTLAEATSVQFAGLNGVLPGFGRQSPNEWGLGFELRGNKTHNWTGSTNDQATFGHFGGSGTLLWVDPRADLALVVLTDREFGPWTHPLWPKLSDKVRQARI